jgi:hypothetical protein
MPEFRPSIDASSCDDAAGRCAGRERILLGLVLITLVGGMGKALAGDAAPVPNASFNPPMGNFYLQSPSPAAAAMSPEFFKVPTLVGSPEFSATDFRARKHSVFEKDPTVTDFGDTSLTRGTTVWQRMSEEYRSRKGVRLLTLWESGASSVSLQAGRRGDPSLQWSSRLSNHGGSTQGLLDRLFSASLGRIGDHLHNTDRSAGAALPKQSSIPATADLK